MTNSKPDSPATTSSSCRIASKKRSLAWPGSPASTGTGPRRGKRWPSSAADRPSLPRSEPTSARATWLPSASMKGRYGIAKADSEHAPLSTVMPSPRAREPASAASLVLPMPASPASSTMPPSPRIAARSASSSSISSTSLPTRTGLRALTWATMPRILAVVTRPRRQALQEAELTQQRPLKCGPAPEAKGVAIRGEVGGHGSLQTIFEVPADQVARLEACVGQGRILHRLLAEQRQLLARAFDETRVITRHSQVIEEVTIGVERRKALDPGQAPFVGKQGGELCLVQVVFPHPCFFARFVSDVLPDPELAGCASTLAASLGHSLDVGVLDGENPEHGRLLRAQKRLAFKAQLLEHRAQKNGVGVVRIAGQAPRRLPHGRVLEPVPDALRFQTGRDAAFDHPQHGKRIRTFER